MLIHDTMVTFEIFPHTHEPYECLDTVFAVLQLRMCIYGLLDKVYDPVFYPASSTVRIAVIANLNMTHSVLLALKLHHSCSIHRPKQKFKIFQTTTLKLQILNTWH